MSKIVVQRIWGRTIVAGVVLAAAVTVTSAQEGNASSNRRNSTEAKLADSVHVSELKDNEIETKSVPGSKASMPPSVASFSYPGLGTEVSLAPKKQPSGSEWEFGFAPYLYATGLRGTLGARGRSIEVDSSFGNVLENLDLGFMGTFEAKKGRWLFVNDLVWTKLGARRESPGPLLSEAEIDVNLLIVDPEAGYRLFESDRGSFDVLGGVRIWSVENRLNVADGLLPGFDVSERKTFAAPVGGFRGLVNVCKKFYLSTKFDIGGGLGPDLTTQFYGGGGFRITQNVALIAGYRYLKVNYDDESGFIFDTTMNGFVFGAKFSF